MTELHLSCNILNAYSGIETTLLLQENYDLVMSESRYVKLSIQMYIICDNVTYTYVHTYVHTHGLYVYPLCTLTVGHFRMKTCANVLFYILLSTTYIRTYWGSAYRIHPQYVW